MNSQHILKALTLTLSLIAAACSGGGSSSPSVVYPTADLPNGPTLNPVNGNNVMTFTVNGSTCNPATSTGYSNKPCVSVTICSTANSANCQTIDDILLDTGSYGLRIFRSVIANNITVTPETHGANTIGECVQFGDGSSDWGQVETGYVALGGEPAVEVPIQVIDSTYSNGASLCPGTNPDNNNGPDDSPTEAGFNGILGVGLFAQDCGTRCATNANNGTYFSCNGTKCTGMKVLTQNQVTNPVTALPVDNNGVILELPSVPFGGIASVGGYLVMGINTEGNNSSSAVTSYPADPGDGTFTTSFNGQTFSTSFIDSGSNGIFLTSPGASVPDCSDASGWFCPASTQSLSATSTASGGSPSVSIPFYIGNFDDLYNTNNNVFIELAGDGSGDFDWGLPFFIGRNVFIGFENSTTNPYWAF